MLRLQNGTHENDANAAGGGKDGNVGEILTPDAGHAEVRRQPGRARSPRCRSFLRIITGDAKAFTNGDANANASWSCTGFEDRQLKDKYPICPEGSQVVRTFKFQSCWDGQNTDSANHRTHVAFADAERQLPATASRPFRSWSSASSTTCRPELEADNRRCSRWTPSPSSCTSRSPTTATSSTSSTRT